ncbi:hypothetical protein QYE76_027450 [Lolium multiflorum]|uniref:Protein FAR1-RELATED SEQUENCE n=1 Tax=Lolium multiflorum TaxID=4521 RepID=A0AAD8QLV1_LOLMU|nr:hypothetical protein QYE76_027450 [Lolium multiflorum]
MDGDAPAAGDGLPSGPRLPAAWNYEAVEAALRDASSRGERCIFLPYQGQVFQSLEEAFEFYNMYSWEAGFEETIEAFKWTFHNFLSIMGMRCPQTILTDQCHQMRVAIEAEMPTAQHRWCKWHVLRKAKESLGPVYNKNTAFKRDLHNLLDVIISVEEFETRWADLVAEHDLVDNEFLSRAYENREMWAKPYFANTFCAGMTSTQRSESANHVLKTYIPRSAPMHLFVTQYDRLVTDRIADEGREEHATKQANFILRTGAPMEKHATSLLYTRSLFERFYRELFRGVSEQPLRGEPVLGNVGQPTACVRLSASPTILPWMAPIDLTATLLRKKMSTASSTHRAHTAEMPMPMSTWRAWHGGKRASDEDGNGVHVAGGEAELLAMEHSEFVLPKAEEARKESSSC